MIRPRDTAGAPSERLHALDACRAAAMLLGLYLHAALAYRPGEETGWAFEDVSRSAWMAASVEVIHAFRMQTFFLLAGFFTALLMSRRGRGAMARNRALRIGVPYLFGIVVLAPLFLAVWMWAGGERATWPALVSEIGKSWHLWFLRELLIFCAAAVLVDAIVPARVLGRIGHVIGTVALHPLGPLALAGVVMVTVLAQPWWGIQAPGVLPPWENLVHYGLFYAIGCGLYLVRARLVELGRRWYGWAVVGALAGAGHFALRAAFEQRGGYDLAVIADEPVLMALSARGAYALMVASLVVAFLGVFLWGVRRGSSAWRYVSDASYWVYLVHFPVVIAAGSLMADWAAPAELKAAIVVASSGAVLFASYALFVRHTWIGRLLNGPRAKPGEEAKAQRPA